MVPPLLADELRFDLRFGQLFQRLYFELAWTRQNLCSLDSTKNRAAVDALDLRVRKGLGNEFDLLDALLGERVFEGTRLNSFLIGLGFAVPDHEYELDRQRKSDCGRRRFYLRY